MKLSCSVFAIFAIVVVVTSDRKAAQKAIKDRGKYCRGGSEKSEAADYNCLIACVMHELGVMDGNKLQADKINKILDEKAKSKKGKTMKQISKSLGRECKGLSDQNSCVAAGKVRVCLADGIKKRGFKPNALLLELLKK